jgi:RsbT co-antagonist protein rsbRD N-terminal domain
MLRDLIKTKKTAILDRWFALILETYPPDTARILKAEKDRFVNPVGATLSKEIEVLYDQLVHEMNSEKISTALENILRIRSIQDFSPSQAVLFIHHLKRAIKEELARELRGDPMFREWMTLESSIDHLSLVAFDIYMTCREKIYESRVHEMKNQKERAFKLMARSGLISDEE